MLQKQPTEPNTGVVGHRGAVRRSRVVAAGLAAVALVAGIALGYSLALSQVREATAEASRARADLERLAGAHDTLQERNWDLYLQLQEAHADAPVLEPDSNLAPGTFADGMYAVGTDIAPGTYQGEVTGEFGYWARLSNTSGMVSGIVANDIVRGPFVLTINPSDVAVELRGATLIARD